VYRQLAAGTDNPQIRGDAVYGLGVLASNYLHDYEVALVYFDSVLNYFPRGQQYIMARREVRSAISASDARPKPGLTWPIS